MQGCSQKIVGEIMMKQNIGSRQIHYILLAIGLSLLLTACGGGGGNGNDPVSASQGVFLDSAVEGLRFETITQSGTTDASGTFRYMAGETVEFFMGDISLGSADGATTLTPIDLVSGATDETNEHVTNILRFLQSLDNDMDAYNGIQISSARHTAMMGQTLNFAQAITDFETDFNVLSGSILGNISLVSAADAQAHMKNTLDDMTGDGSGGGNQGLGNITISGADTPTTGSSYTPTMEGSSTVGTATSVNWSDLSGTTLGFSAVGNQIASLTYIFQSGSVSQAYLYSVSCWPVAAAECSKITLDVANKRLVLNNARLMPTSSSVILTNIATGPSTLNGTLYWE